MKALTPRSCPPQQLSSPPFWPYVNQDYPATRGLHPAPTNCKCLSGFSCSKPLSPSRDQVPSPWTTLPSSLALVLPEPGLFSSPRCTKCQVRSTLSSPGKPFSTFPKELLEAPTPTPTRLLQKAFPCRTGRAPLKPDTQPKTY